MAVALLATMTDAHTPGSLVRNSEVSAYYELLNLSDDRFGWTIYVESIYDTDTGYEWLRITHDLTANILATDTVAFELAFRSTNDPFIDKKNLIAEDSAICEMSQSTTDTRFWAMEAKDYFYQCQNSIACDTISEEPAATVEAQNTDWEIPILDDDKDNPFCIPPAI